MLLSRNGWAWTDERVEKLKGYLADGLTATQIAEAFGPKCSRSAVIGKVFRTEGLKFSVGRHATKEIRPVSIKEPPPAPAPIPSAPQTIAPLAPTPSMGAWKAKQEDDRRAYNQFAKAQRPKATESAEKQRTEIAANIARAAVPDQERAAAGAGVTIMDLGRRSCRWPISSGAPDPATYLYCGAPRDGESVYCACHRARAYDGRGQRASLAFSDGSVRKAAPKSDEPEELAL